MVRKLRINLGWLVSQATPLIIFPARLIFLAALVLLFLTEAEGIDISAIGGWTETVNASDLISGPGSNLVDTYESMANATSVSISNTQNKNDNWRVDVRRVDGGNWHANFRLYVKRTSNGIGPGSISGGLSYIEINTTDSQFFSGAGNRSNIYLQYRLTGMSVSVSPGNRSTTITFTVVDI